MSGHTSNYEPKSAFGKWMHERLPIMELVKGQALDFPTPKNLNYWYTFGGILTFMLTPGGGGMTGSLRVSQAVPDSHVFVLASIGTHAIGYSMHKRPAYHPADDFQPVIFVAEAPLLTAAAVVAGPTAHAFAFSGGVSHVVTHPLAMSTTMPTEHPADVRVIHDDIE